jgi:hypothetical protein
VAERIVTLLIDDIDGSDITDGGQHVEFTVRGVSYAIDLSKTNAAKFDRALKPYVEAASRIGSPAKPTARKRSTKAAASDQTPRLEDVRAWARENGYEVSDRGRIRGEVLEAFHAAQ